MSKEAMKLALEAKIHNAGMNPIMQGECYLMHPEAMQKIIDEALREAQAQQALNKKAENARELGLDYEPAQEPVAWMTKDGEIYKSACWPEHEARPLVFGDTSPPAQCTWVSLTDEEIESIFNNWPTYHLDHEDFARVIEAKLKEKNT